MNPHNRVAVVTGAGTGIGKAVALALREAVEPDPARSGIASTKGVL